MHHNNAFFKSSWVGIGLSSLSYRGYNRFGVGIDEGIYREPTETKRLCELIEQELETLRAEEII